MLLSCFEDNAYICVYCFCSYANLSTYFGKTNLAFFTINGITSAIYDSLFLID